MESQTLFRGIALLLVTGGLALVQNAEAQPSGRRTTRDGKHQMVNRAEAGLQWAVSYTPQEGVLTGNVFDPSGGEPAYVWCRRVGDDGVMDPNEVEILWQCEGAERCNESPCDASGWSSFGNEPIPLGGFFFQPAVDPFITLMQPGAYCDTIRVGPVTEFGNLRSFEVDSSICSYATMTQRALTPIEEGDGIWVRIWNYQLDNPRDGSVFVTLMIEDEVVYSEELLVPRSSGLLGPRDENGDPIGLCLKPGAVPAGALVALNIQTRDAPEGVTTSTRSDLARPAHSSPGVIHALDFSVSADCVAEDRGRQLVNADRWDLVSDSLPRLP